MLIHEDMKIIGVVEKKIAEINALVRIVALKDHNKLYQEFDPIEKFPPLGYVFGPSFFPKNPKIVEGDLIDFECQENKTYTGDDNKTKYIVVDGSVNKNGYIKTYNLENLPIKDRYVNINNIPSELIDCNKHFCVSDGRKILGKLQVAENRRIEPVIKKRVYVWNKESCDIIDDDKVSYVNLPTGECTAYDCMDESKLFEWFRKKLRALNPEYVRLLDEKTGWRQDFPDLFDRSDEESLKLDRYRLERVLNRISGMELSLQDIKNLIDTSENFQTVFKGAIKNHIDSFRSEYEDELTECSAKYDLEKIHLSGEVQKIKGKIVKETQRLKELQEKVNMAKTEVDNILKNKERILTDFSIIQDVLNTNPLSSIQTKNHSRSSYVVELVDEKYNSTEITQKKDCLVRLEYFLETYKIDPRMASKFLNLVLCYKGIFVEKIEYGVALANALGNTKYIIQQVEPDWLHFYQFWENGLNELWQSSHENPDIMHLLLLEDINLASPECYARPLMDAIYGIRKRIPYAKSEMPENLRILASKISFEDPPIGLPLYSTLFNGWGAIGFKKSNSPDENNSTKLINGYLTMQTLQKFIPNEFEKDNIKEDMKGEFENLFNGI